MDHNKSCQHGNLKGKCQWDGCPYNHCQHGNLKGKCEWDGCAHNPVIKHHEPVIDYYSTRTRVTPNICPHGGDKISCENCAHGRPAKEAVNHPSYYQSGKMEVIEVIEAFSLDFPLGNTIKYILRAGKKGNKLEDLEKAAWYLNRAITKLKEPK